MVRWPQAELREEHVTQARLEVLPGVHDHQVALRLEDGFDAAEVRRR
jgi:hypothetical protein